MLVLQLLGAFRYLANEWKLWKNVKRFVMALIMLALTALSGEWTLVEASGNEALCATLGANCIASEPLNTSTYTDLSGTQYWSADDTTTKKAFNDVVGAVAATSSGFPATAINSGAAITALPAGHTVTWVLKEPDGGGDTQSFGHKFALTDPTALRSLRFYRFYSSDHAWATGSTPGCNSGKLIQMGPEFSLSGGPYFDFGGNGSTLMQNINTAYNWNMTNAGTSPAPGGSFSLTEATIRGRWWRFEFRMHNAASGGTATWMDVFAKNITDNLPEVTIADTRVPLVGQWESPFTDGLHVASGQIRSFAVNPFRSPNTDPCPGYIAHTHILWAAWDTDSNQRIGAATEIEGTGGGGGASSTAIYVMIMKSIVPISIGLESMVLGSFLISRRSSLRQFAVTAKRYCQSLPSPHDIYWMMKYRHAVKRWQNEAPLMLPLPRQTHQHEERTL